MGQSHDCTYDLGFLKGFLKNYSTLSDALSSYSFVDYSQCYKLEPQRLYLQTKPGTSLTMHLQFQQSIKPHSLWRICQPAIPAPRVAPPSTAQSLLSRLKLGCCYSNLERACVIALHHAMHDTCHRASLRTRAVSSPRNRDPKI